MHIFGTHPDGPVHQATLRSSAAEVDVLSYGAILRDWRVADAGGALRTITLGFDSFEPYLANPRSFGIVAGRIANRVRNASFTLGGTTYHLDANEPPHHLHGGSRGLGRQLWALEADERRARLTVTSPDGEMGYPGSVRFAVEITLDGPTLTFDMTGTPDEPTPVSLAQHSYYNLTGGPTVAGHTLWAAADRTTATDAELIPTGAIVPLEGDRDFRTPRPVDAVPLDLNLCLTDNDPAANLEGGGLRLTLSTDQPGLQVYNGHNMTDVTAPGLGGRRYGPYAGLALEAQHWPDAVHHPQFPSVIATPERPYRQTTRITVAPA